MHVNCRDRCQGDGEDALRSRTVAVATIVCAGFRVSFQKVLSHVTLEHCFHLFEVLFPLLYGNSDISLAGFIWGLKAGSFPCWSLGLLQQKEGCGSLTVQSSLAGGWEVQDRRACRFCLASLSGYLAECLEKTYCVFHFSKGPGLILNSPSHVLTEP